MKQGALSSRRTGEGWTVLVVEDDHALNQLIRKTLHRAGLAAVGVPSGAEALERLSYDNDVLLLLDYQLPDMKAVELVERMRAGERAAPFIVITGRGDERVAVQMMMAGARDYIVKEPGFLGLLTDRVERVLRELETEQMLAEAEQNLRWYESIVSASTDMLAILNKDFVYLATNAAYLEALGKTSEEVVGHSVQSLYDLEFFETVIRPHAERCLAGEEVHYQAWFEFPARERRCMDVSYYPHLDEDQMVAGFVVCGRNITERKRAEEERRSLEARVRQAERMESLGVMAGGIAHDFNNMLATITGNSELALVALEPGSKTYHHVRQVLVAAEHSASMVKQILAFSRQTEHEKAAVSLGDIVAEAVELLRMSLPASIAIRQETAGRAPLVLADGTQIQQVIINMCVNAHHAMREKGGTLTLSLSRHRVTADEVEANPEAREGEYAHLAIRDTGEGIAPELLTRIFDPFFTTKELGEGTGMGLATSHGIVAAHGGFITVESELGAGTVFHVYLPVAAELEEGAENKPPPAPEEARQGRERLLVVDDQASLLVVISRMLEEQGYSVTSFSSSPEALAAFQQSPQAWDLLVLDQTMPVMSGSEMLHAVRSLRSDLPVVIMTGHSDQLTNEADGGVGASGMLRKPFRGSELATMLRQLLDSDPQGAQKSVLESLGGGECRYSNSPGP